MDNNKKVSQSITLNNPNESKYLLKTNSKKKNQNNKVQKYFFSKKILFLNNLTLVNITNIKKQEKKLEKKSDKSPNIKTKKMKNKYINSLKNEQNKIDEANKVISTSKKKNRNNKNMQNKYKSISISKNFSYNNYSITDNRSCLKNKMLFTPKSISTSKKPLTKKDNSHYLNLLKNKKTIKYNLNKTLFEKNLYNSNNKNASFKPNEKYKKKGTIPLNLIYRNNMSKVNLEENITNIQHEKILVIDLDETLIHTSFNKIPNPDFKIILDSTIFSKKNSKNKNIELKKVVEAYICIRPGVDEFLSQLSKHYSLYVYSASSKQYLNNIIKNIDKNNIIEKCYCREDCIIYVENTEEDFDKPNNKYNYVKDLKKINKDLRNIVFVDNNIMSFKLQEKNGIPIKSWYNDYDDIELYKLIPILKNLAGFYDVRIEIEKFVKNKTFIWSKSINWLKNNCLNLAYLNEINLVIKKEQQISNFKIANFNNDINNNNKQNNIYNKTANKSIKNGKNKIINHISNILINLNEINSNNANKSISHMIEKSNKLYEKTNMEIKNSNKKSSYKTLNSKRSKLFKSDKIGLKIENKSIIKTPNIRKKNVIFQI